MTTRLAGRDDPVPAVQPGPRRRGRATRRTRTGTRTAYLWEQVWQRDAWLDLLGRFVHVEKPAKGSKKPAAGDLPALPPVGRRARARGRRPRARAPGSTYLVQHSAGSGKSNTIAWLAHRLSTLHDAATRKVFDKVVVITDRVVLDRQLQDTIYQFEHAHGVVEQIDEDSGQLADGADRRAGADHHHDAAEVPVRPRQGRRRCPTAATR